MLIDESFIHVHLVPRVFICSTCFGFNFSGRLSFFRSLWPYDGARNSFAGCGWLRGRLIPAKLIQIVLRDVHVNGDQCLMAVETAVTLHENPLEKIIVWEKRSVENDSKHRIRPQSTISKIDTIAKKDEYHSDYCVIAAATKRTTSTTPRQPILVADRDNRLRLSTSATNRTFNAFVRRHTGGTLRAPPSQVVTSQPRPIGPATPVQSRPTCRSNVLQCKHREDDDIKLFCCNRDVDMLIDYASCMCGVKAVLYHCSKDSFDEGSAAQHPCSCGPPRKSCIGRWGCLAACSFFLPCLLCYVPLKGCSEVCVCYKRQKIASRQRQRRPKDPVWSVNNNEGPGLIYNLAKRVRIELSNWKFVYQIHMPYLYLPCKYQICLKKAFCFITVIVSA